MWDAYICSKNYSSIKLESWLVLLIYLLFAFRTNFTFGLKKNKPALLNIDDWSFKVQPIQSRVCAEPIAFIVSKSGVLNNVASAAIPYLADTQESNSRLDALMHFCCCKNTRFYRTHVLTMAISMQIQYTRYKNNKAFKHYVREDISSRFLPEQRRFFWMWVI